MDRIIERNPALVVAVLTAAPPLVIIAALVILAMGA